MLRFFQFFRSLGKKSKNEGTQFDVPISSDLLQKTNSSIAQKPHDYYLDCTGMLCPRPLFEISKKIKDEVEVGQVLLVECKDPAFKADVTAWTGRMNCDLDLEQVDQLYLAYIQKN